MKNSVKKLLVMFLLIPALVCGCSNTDKDPDAIQDETAISETVESTEDTEAYLSDDLPEQDYENYKFRVIIYDGPEQDYDIVTAGAETGELMNDSVYSRNRAVEERYNIQYEVLKTTDLTMISSSILAQSDDFDSIFYPVCYSISLANQGCYLPVSKLENINLDKPWWDEKLREGLSINNNLYVITGDISPSSLNMASCMLFNKDLLDSQNIEYPYEMVSNGTWTLDALAQMIKGQTVDLNGDSKIDTDNDRYGLAGWMYNVPFSLYYGSGGMTVTKDSSDIPSVQIDMERTSQIVDKIYNILYTNESYFAINTAEEYENTYKVFGDGRALILDTTLLGLEKLREMDSDYGIVPIPKLNEEQQSYISFVNAASNMVSVPTTVSDLERTGIILEAMAAESYHNLTPVFKDIILKYKLTRDTDSSDMLDIIIRNRVFDIGYINDLPGVGTFIRPLMMEKNTDVVSYIEKTRKMAENSLKKITDNIIAIDHQ